MTAELWPVTDDDDAIAADVVAQWRALRDAELVDDQAETAGPDPARIACAAYELHRLAHRWDDRLGWVCDRCLVDVEDPDFIAAAAVLLPGVRNLAALTPAARARIVDRARHRAETPRP